MDISGTGHLVVFATIVEEDLSVTFFLDLLQFESGKMDTAVIFDSLISNFASMGFRFV